MSAAAPHKVIDITTAGGFEQLPPAVRPALEHYVAALRESAGDLIRAVYVQGSIALGAFDPRTSDIDFTTVLTRSADHDLVRTIARVHRACRKAFPMAGLMEGIYIPEADLRHAGTGRLFHYVKHGRLRGADRLGSTGRKLLFDRGVTLFGPPPRELISPVPREAVDAEMRWNLNVYWRRRARRPWLLLFDQGVDFAVLTLPRVLHALETGEIISKPEALTWLEHRYPEWRKLAGDVRRRMPSSDGSEVVPRRIRRARAARRFIHAMILAGNDSARNAS